MKKNLFILILLLFSLASCYEDKGNYKYSNIQELIIEFSDFDGTLNMGDTLKINPTFNIDIPEDAPYMTYRWSINGNSRNGWNKRNLEWITDTIMSYTNINFEAIDTRTGLVFTKSEIIRINGIYDAEGWVVLSEIDKKSVLSFVKFTTTATGGIEVFKNAYEKNNGEAMGQNPIDFQEHFYFNGPVGQFIIFQDTPIDIDGYSFKKVMNLSETFEGGNMPPKIVGGTFMNYLDVLYDDKGQIYSRIKSTNELFHSNYFLSKPIQYENEILKDCKVIRGRYTDYQATLIHDKKQQRFLYMFDGGIDFNESLLYAGYIATMPDKPTYGDIPTKYFSLDNTSTYDIIEISYCINFNNYGYKMLIKEKSTGKYYYQMFEIDKEYSTTDFTIGNMKVQEIKGLDFLPDVVCLQTYTANNYIFCSKGDKLYMYDLDYPDDPIELYIDFGKEYSTPVKIKSMNGDVWANSNMGLGLDNGDFCIVRVEGAKNFETIEEKIKHRLDPKDYLGNIIKVYPKIGNIGNWN